MTRRILGLLVLLLILTASDRAVAQDSRPTRDQGPVATLLQKARDAGALKAIPRVRFFQELTKTGKPNEDVVLVEFATYDDGFKVEFVEFKGKLGTWEGSQIRMGYDGSFKKLRFAEGKMGGKPDQEWRGTITADGKLELKLAKGAGKRPPRTVPLEWPLVPVGMGLFVIPCLHDHFPAQGLSYRLLTRDSVSPPLTARKKNGEVTLKLGNVSVRIVLKGGTIEKVIGPDGSTLVPMSMKAVEAFMKKFEKGGASSSAASVIATLRTLSSAQSLFREGDKEGDGMLDYALNLGELGKAGLIDAKLASGVKFGYRFKIGVGEYPEYLWWATASPESGKGRYFATSHEGVVYYRDDQPIDVDPKTCEIKNAKPVGK